MVEPGQTVRLRYRITLDDGTEVENTYDRPDPAELVIGSRTLLPAIERALCDMEEGQTKSVRIPAVEAYGLYDDGLVKEAPASLLPDGERTPLGSRVVFSTQAGLASARILEISGGQVLLDFNHEFAGREVIAQVLLHSVPRETAVEREIHGKGCACGCDRLKASLGRSAD